MTGRTDQELLREYALSGAESAFSELVQRYVDLVYSAAFRLAGDPNLAEEVAQKVFVALAQNASRLAGRAVLSPWLHRTTHNLSANAVRTEARRRAREQKAAAMSELLVPDPEGIWEMVAPQLDTALNQLSEADRQAVLLRYFQSKSALEMAQVLGISDEAAQKRVQRAVERLRDFFADRGILAGTSALTVLLGSRTVAAAPPGLASRISAAAIAKAACSSSICINTIKLLIMTTLQKTLITSAVVVVVAVGMYQVRKPKLPRAQARADEEQNASGVSAQGPEAPARGAKLARDRSRVRPPEIARAKHPAAPAGFQATELYALLRRKVSRLTPAQAEPYLKAKDRSAASLLGAFRTTGNPALLAEAVKKYPRDPEVGFEAATQIAASPGDRRAALEMFKRAAPDNSLANYLSALAYFQAGNREQAVQELNAAAAKPGFQDYGTGRTQADEAAYLAAGYPPGEAKMISNSFLPEPHLNQVRELGGSLVDLAAGYQQAGDPSSREIALQMALDLGRRLDDPTGAQPMRWQLIGIRVERAALEAMDPSSALAGSGQLARDRLAELAARMTTIQGLTAEADPIWKTLSDQEWTEFHNQMAAAGEEAAVQWLVDTRGAR